MARPEPKLFTVVRSEYVTPNMLRVTVGGEAMKSFPKDQESGYIKLIFPSENGRLMRTYTIRQQREDEMDIDFAIHGEGENQGIACKWALNAQPGDEILIGGPGPKKLASENTDWMLFVGDMTSLPAISVNLEQLPRDAKGYALLEVQTESDIQPLHKPEGIKIKWLINDRPGQDSNALLDNIKSLDWLDGSLSLWAACEFSSMRNIRAYFKDREDVSKADFYVSSYWKMGLNEDQHKVEKRNDLDAIEA